MICMERWPGVSPFDCNLRFLARTTNDPTWEFCYENQEMPEVFPDVDMTEATIRGEDVKLTPIYFDQNYRGVFVGYCELNNEILIRSA